MKNISLEKYFVSLSKDSLIYGMGNAVLRILALVTAPIFTRIFLPAEYGVISLIASVISFLSLFMIFGMDNALFVSFYEYKTERKAVISSAFWFLVVWGLALTLLVTILVGSLSHLIIKNDMAKILLLVAFITAYLTLIINIIKTVLRVQFRAKTFALISVVHALATSGLMILLVVYYKKGLLGYFEGSLLGTAITLLVALAAIRANLKFRLDWHRLKEMLKFGAPVVPASLSFFVFDLSDRFFLNHYRTLSELGLYSIAINIVGLIVFFSYAFGQAWSPQVMKIYFESKKIFHQFVPRFFNYYLIFFFGLAVLITVFGQEILRIFTTSKFYAASQVLPSLSLAMVFAATNQVTALGITISRKTKHLAFYTFLAALLNLALNFLLIPKYGMVGAGWATAFSYLFLTLGYYSASRRFITFQFDWSKIFKIIFINLLAIFLFPKLWLFSASWNLVVKIGEIIVFLILLYLLGAIEQHEVRYLKQYMVKFLKIAK